MGFGRLEDATTPNKRKVCVFRKRPYCNLTEECQTQLKRAKISEALYSSSFKATPGQLDGQNPPEASQFSQEE